MQAITNRIAILLGLLIFCFVAVDFFVYGWEKSVFLGRKFLALTEYVKFWR